MSLLTHRSMFLIHTFISTTALVFRGLSVFLHLVYNPSEFFVFRFSLVALGYYEMDISGNFKKGVAASIKCHE